MAGDWIKIEKCLHDKPEVEQIAAMTGLSANYVYIVGRLLERGERRLVAAVEAGYLATLEALKTLDGPLTHLRRRKAEAVRRKLALETDIGVDVAAD